MVRIELNGLEFFAHHGVYSHERENGNSFLVNISVETNATTDSDELSDTVDYELLYTIVAKEMAVPSKLLEHIASRICDQVLQQVELAEQVMVRVSKSKPPISGKVLESAVTVSKQRQ